MAKIPASTQQFIPLKNIKEGVVILKDGGLRKVLMVSSVNFALKSQDEQMAILLQFQNFLNSLDFSVQLVVQSRKLDIAPYLELLKSRVDESENDLIKIQVREYMQYIQSLTSSINIMSKSFFVIIPYAQATLPTDTNNYLRSFFKKEGEVEVVTDDRFEEYKTQLDQRALVVEQGLSSVGLRTIPLGSDVLIELFYKSFNPDEKNRAPVSENP